MEKMMTNALNNGEPQQQTGRARLIARLGKNHDAPGGIARRVGNQPAPLSYSQERLWIMSRLEPDNPVYNVAGAVRFDGPLNGEALRQSLDEVVRRHEILRSRFADEDGEARQWVLPGGGLPLARLDLGGIEPGEAMALFEQCADEFTRQPFLLDEQPPLRALLAAFGGRRHVLLLTLHHIVSDRWSVGVLMGEVAALYDACGGGMPQALPELPVQYGDFCAWQRGRREKDAGHLDYWRRKLAGAPPLLELPADRPRPPTFSYRGDTRYFELAAEGPARALKDLGKRCNATLFMVMAAALNALLYRYTGSRDVCVGYPVAGRGNSQTAALIGFFVNTLVLRGRATAAMPFSELLSQLREQALQDQDHQDIAFGQLLDALNPVRDTSHAPLFQVMLAVQNVPMPDFQLREVSARPLAVNNRASQFDLTLFVDERDGKLHGGLEYSTDLFDAATIDRMAGHLRTLLAGAAENPELPLKDLPLLSRAETGQLLGDWSGQDVAYPEQRLIHQLFEEQARMRPDKTALVFAGQAVAHGELDRRAEVWAGRLRALGVGPECRVGVCAGRSLELIIGLLAVLKAGAAYVPLDPDYPEDRLDFMLDDAGIALLLTQAALADRFRHRVGALLCLDGEGGGPEADGAIPAPSRPPSPDNTAYIIYTSGSTGRPKGVAVSHRNLLHSTNVRTRYYREPLECFLLLSSFAFDSSVAGIFWTLGQGGCLCLPRQEELTDAAALAGLIRQHRVTHLLALPSFYAALADEPNLPRLKTLRAVIVAGEACPGEIAAEHRRKLPEVAFYNEYGPTEGTVWSSVYRSVAGESGAMLPIGRAIDNVRIYILDSGGQPTPIGVGGELCLGGAGLAQGYVNQPGLTAEKFMPDPFGAGGARLYKTGDLARFRADGEIEFLGRVDNQVKIRGYRIELGEIEARLRQYPGIEAAAVLAREDKPGAKRLIAYLVGRLPETRDLQHHLAQTLPDYMVPPVFIGLDSLPLTPNGKLDTKALPQPIVNAPSGQDREPPQTPVEKILAGIWRDLLAVEHVGRHDNFFELGGDSILGIQMASRARQAGVVVTPRQLFQHRTVAALATAAGQGHAVLAEQGAVFGELPLTPIQRWFFEQNLDNPHHWNQALLLETGPGLTPAILEDAVGQLLIHHDALRTRFERDGGEWRQTVPREGARLVFERVDLSGVPAERRAAMLEAAASNRQARLHLSTGPLLRAAWFNLGEGQSGRLLMVVHHLVVDGVSWRILLEDLASACRHLMAGEVPSLPAKTASFRQWSGQLAARVRAGVLPLDPAYWLDPGRNEAWALPVDNALGNNTVAAEDSVAVTLTEAETRALLREVPAAYGAKIDEALLAALALALRDWTGRDTLLIDLEGHGREDGACELDISRTVGWFTTVYPALLTLSGAHSPGDALKSAKEQLRAIPLRGMSYGLLRQLSPDAGIRARLAAQPRAGIIFNYLGQLDTAIMAAAPFLPAREAVGASRDPAGVRAHELALTGSIFEGRLRLVWDYGKERYRRDTIERVAALHARHLRALVAHCLLPGAGGYTPADFPLAALAQAELDAMALEPRRIEAIYPLAPLQHGLMFQSLYAPESGVYCIQLGCRLLGELDAPAFARAWQRVVDHHPILRTAFHAGEDDRLVQIVHKHAQLPVTAIDWRGCPAGEQAARRQQLLADDQARGFDFGRAPLMRLTLAQCAEREHYLLWSYHHVLLDGWSSPLLIKDVFAAYAASRQGREVRLPAARPYGDYIAWLQQQDTAAAKAYWRAALSGFGAPTPLLADPAADGQPGVPAKQALALPEARSQALRRFVQRRQLTLNTLAQGAWALLLGRYSGDGDVVFGATASGRPADMVEVESMVGLFINTLPIRVKLPADAVAADWLQALLAQNQDMRRHEYLPLTQIQGCSDVPRGVSLFDSLLVFENYPIDQALAEGVEGLSVDSVSVLDQTHYPLTLSAFPGTELRLEITYDQGRFQAETIGRMLAHLQCLLEAFAEQPEARLSELPMLGEAERRQILSGWNATFADYPRDQNVHQLVEAQAAKTPDAVAVIHAGQALGYAELNGKANQLAHYLLGKGVGPETLVGVCLERSPDMIVGLLAILKAGGAYVPLDPAYPSERLAYMLGQSQCRLLLSQQSVLASLPQDRPELILLDAGADAWRGQPTANPGRVASRQRTAYVIYTSGSTGQPKGVQITQQNLTNFLWAMRDTFNPGGRDRVLALTSLSFDIAALELYLPLIRGAAVVLADRDSAKDAARLAAIIREAGVTFIQATPATWRLLDGVELPGGPTLISGGEALSADLAGRLLAKGGALWNLYGPTETTVWSATYPVASAAGNIAIGRPLANTRIHVLDRRLNPVPAGAPGELYIGGDGLARGYLHQPGLTAERFIPNPFDDAGSRLYKTGDLARYRSDGTLDCLGRIDHQVKIRGFRIEPGEIESQLLKHAGVKEAVVSARADKTGEPRLTAYVVGHGGGHCDAAVLAAFLKTQLPDYMIPGAFVFLDALPLTPNGKVDPKALPSPDASESLRGQYVAPRDATETILAEIWAAVLGVGQVGVEDSFFELGGHSLTATVLLSRVNKRFQLDIPLHAVFASPTIAKLRGVIEERLIEKLEALSDDDAENLFNQHPGIVE